MIKLRGVDVVWRCIDGEVIVLDTRASLYLTLKGSGALLWAMMAEGTSREVLVDALVGRYGIAEERAAMDVESFIGGLVERKLLDDA